MLAGEGVSPLSSYVRAFRVVAIAAGVASSSLMMGCPMISLTGDCPDPELQSLGVGGRLIERPEGSRGKRSQSYVISAIPIRVRVPDCGVFLDIGFDAGENVISRDVLYATAEAAGRIFEGGSADHLEIWDSAGRVALRPPIKGVPPGLSFHSPILPDYVPRYRIYPALFANTTADHPSVIVTVKLRTDRPLVGETCSCELFDFTESYHPKVRFPTGPVTIPITPIMSEATR